MTELVFAALALFLVATAALAWVNLKWVHWPLNITVLTAGLLVAIGLMVSERLVPALAHSKWVERGLSRLDFSDALLEFVLAFIMFAGGMKVDVAVFKRKWTSAAMLAWPGTLLSVVVVSFGLTWLARWLSFELPFVWALVFATLVSPTDPVAVLGMSGGSVSAELKAVLQGEALFNDGVGIVLFGAAIAATAPGAELDVQGAAGDVLRQSVVALLVGACGGGLLVFLTGRIDDSVVEIILTLAAATGVFALARALHASGPIAASVAGLLAGGSRGRRAMSKETSEYLEHFWEVVDHLLTALIFLVIGLEAVLLEIDARLFGLAAVAALLALIARVIAVSVPGLLMRALGAGVELRAVPTLVWGGVRGAVTIALALAVSGPHRKELLACAYASVLLSMLLQAPTLSFVARKTQR